MAVAGEAMTKKNPDRYNVWLWQPAAAREIPPAGDVVIHEPKEGWSRAFYAAVVQHYFAVRGAYPRTARMHPMLCAPGSAGSSPRAGARAGTYDSRCARDWSSSFGRRMPEPALAAQGVHEPRK